MDFCNKLQITIVDCWVDEVKHQYFLIESHIHEAIKPSGVLELHINCGNILEHIYGLIQNTYLKHNFFRSSTQC